MLVQILIFLFLVKPLVLRIQFALVVLNWVLVMNYRLHGSFLSLTGSVFETFGVILMARLLLLGRIICSQAIWVVHLVFLLIITFRNAA